MRLASLKAGGRDGSLVIVDRSGRWAVGAGEVARTLQAALDDWVRVAPQLQSMEKLIDRRPVSQELTIAPSMLAAPLPRAYQWADGSAYLPHIERVRRARGAEPPASVREDPLIYQGGSDAFLGPTDPIPLRDPAWGLDFEAEVAVVTGDVPMGTTPEAARRLIRLVMLVNDVSLRGLVPAELAKGFGFFQSKPASAFSPFAVTPDELGEAWDGGRLHLPILVHWNGKEFGRPNAAVDMLFDFGELIAHAARTRWLAAGSIIGSGTVSNRDPAAGYACIVEKRAVEKTELGKSRTPFLAEGDTVRIEALTPDGRSPFGAIEQKVVAA